MGLELAGCQQARRRFPQIVYADGFRLPARNGPIAGTRGRLVRVAAVAALLVLPWSAPPARAAAPGVNVDLTWGISRRDIDREMTFLRASNVRWVRMNVPWNGVEVQARGRYDWRFVATVDYAVAQVLGAGIRIVMPVADGVPYWASADPRRRVRGGRRLWNRFYRPRRFSDYGRFAGWVARRYSRRGVHVFEVWNEPDLAQFWPSGPSPRRYAAMLRAAYGPIKRADRASTVLLGGLYQNDDAFLRGVYAARGRRFFDAVGDHSYPDGDPRRCWRDRPGHWSRRSLCGIAGVRAVMRAHGDGARAIWLTEFGWSTARGHTGSTDQARYIAAAMDRLGRDFPAVTAALVYNLRNDYWLGDDPRVTEANYGLLRTDFTPKPGYGGLVAASRAPGAGAFAATAGAR
ncbi:MAG: polysaccharide biosynthesis protein PslG [Solirubrobacteraceae bacterium]|nr:polysaccharide biosynthesis protein PslG [Solirubrobacteraceae bacterium]